MTNVVIRHGALDESDLRGGSIILRGVIDPDTLRYIKVDDYQREAALLTSLSELIHAIQCSDALPDGELGMRGQKFTSKEDVFKLQNDTYIIDGLQRISAALQVLAMT